jgi:myo-inositol-1(or 4)-monophosphatase
VTGIRSDIALLERAARAAGDIARARFGTRLSITNKDGGSPVTDVDLAMNKVLRGILRDARPDYGWLSEEDPDDGSRHSAKRTFITDPLDGTVSFIKQKHDFSIAIAIVESGRSIAGCVYQPMGDVMVSGGPDTGTMRNGAPVCVADVARLEGADVIGSDAFYGHPFWKSPWPPLALRSVGSACLRLAQVASGEADWTMALAYRHAWDSAPGSALIEGAGGIASDHLGRQLAYNGRDPGVPSLVVAGRQTHALLIERTNTIPLSNLPGASGKPR